MNLLHIALIICINKHHGQILLKYKMSFHMFMKFNLVKSAFNFTSTLEKNLVECFLSGTKLNKHDVVYTVYKSKLASKIDISFIIKILPAYLTQFVGFLMLVFQLYKIWLSVEKQIKKSYSLDKVLNVFHRWCW